MATAVLVCRVCQTTDNLELIFKKENAEILSRLNSFLSSTITYDETNPPCMCTQCIFTLDDIHDFKSLYQKTYNKFKKTSICNDRWQDTKITPKSLENASSQASDDSVGFLLDSTLNDESETKKAFSKCFKLRETSESNDDYEGVQKIEESADEKSEEQSLVDQISISNEPETFHTNMHQAVGSKFKLLYKCDKCEKSFTTPYSLKKHQVLRCNSDPYKSPCTTLKEQKLTQSGLKPYACSKCEKTFTRADYLKYHEAVTCIYAKPDPYRCEYCGKSFISESYFQKHLALHNNPDLYKCKDCGMVHTNENHLKEHQDKKCRSRCQFNCRYCQMIYSSANALAKHEELCSNAHTSKVQKASNSKRKLYECTECNKWILSLFRYRAHIALHSNPEIYKCNDCGTLCRDPCHLREHKHKLCRSKGPFKCAHCEKLCNSIDALEKHQVLHFIPDLHKCQECGESLSSMSSLIKHRKNKHSGIVRKCETCGKVYNDVNLYRAHVALHTNPDLFKCKECGKSFSCSKTLKVHLAWHKNPDIYKCEVCGKSFTMPHHLRSHLAWHANAYNCLECGKSFAEATKLKNHQLMHSNPDLHKCEVCGKSFSALNSLRKHLKRHSNPDLKMTESPAND